MARGVGKCLIKGDCGQECYGQEGRNTLEMKLLSGTLWLEV